MSLPAFAQRGVASSGNFAQSAAAPPSAPQSPVLSQRPPPALKSNEGRIQLDVVATDVAGKPVSGLRLRDFTLLDNQQPQNVVSFHAFDGLAAKADPPVEIILLIDTVNTSFQRVAYTRKEIKKFLLQNGGHLTRPVSLILFSEDGAKIQNRPSNDGNALAAVLDRNATAIRTLGPATGLNGDLERSQLSIQTLTSLTVNEARKPGRKILIWIGEGWPMLAGPDLGLSPQTHQLFFDSIVGLSSGLREARITLYSIDPLDLSSGTGDDRFLYQSFLEPVGAPMQADSGNLALQVLAIQSGGRVLNPSGDVAGQIASCIADASTYYTLSFDPPRTRHADEYHQLEVRISKPGVIARTNTGYYAEP